MNQPLVSVITPCYNGEAYLDRYFLSILAQSYPNIELIFINDGSADRTEEIAMHYKPLLEGSGIEFVYEYQENAGQAAALNRGLKLFKGEFLTWPDADDEMTPDCIEKKVAFLQAHPEYQLVRSDGVCYNESTGKKTGIAKPEDKGNRDIFRDLLVVGTYGCCGCYMMTRELFLQCYPDRDIFESRAGQNWQLLVPAASRSLCGYIDAPLYVVYEHTDSHSRQERTAEQWYERWDMFTEILRQTIKVSQCDTESALRLVAENNARQQFYYAASVRDRAVLKKNARLISQNGRMTLKERLLYWKCMLKG